MNTLTNKINRMLGRDLNGIVSTFTVAIRRLDELNRRNTAMVEANEVRIRSIVSMNADLAIEAARAEIVRNKIAALVS